MSEHGGDLVFHLISAHEVAWTGRVSPRYFAACGAVVPAPALAEATECPNECECELSPRMAYCEKCVREAIRQNHRAEVDAETVAAGG